MLRKIMGAERSPAKSGALQNIRTSFSVAVWLQAPSGNAIYSGMYVNRCQWRSEKLKRDSDHLCY